MTQSRMLEIRQLIEACQYTDNSAVEVEKTAVIVELLAQRTLEDAAEHGSMTAEEIAGLLKLYDEANESLVECDEPEFDEDDEWREPGESDLTADEGSLEESDAPDSGDD